MIKSINKYNELALLLKRDDPVMVAQAIEFLREEEAFEGAVGLLSGCYDETNGSEVKKAIEGLMNDLKDKSLRMEVIKEIKKGWNQPTIRMLVSSCWQSGMDYSEFARDFAEVFLSCDYTTAIECFTVIEESVPDLSNVKKYEIIELLEDHPFPVNNPKEILRHELISALNK